MSGICGWVGRANPERLAPMLDAIDYRGDTNDSVATDDFALGYRWWRGRPGKSPGLLQTPRVAVACAGTLAPAVSSPAAALADTLQRADKHGIDADLDGAFAAAVWDHTNNSLTLIRDPFGIRSLYYVTHQGVVYFASELKQLLTLAGLPVELNSDVVHKYLTFSFCPGEDTPIKGVRRLLPGHRARIIDGQVHSEAWFELSESRRDDLLDQHTAVRATRAAWRDAVRHRLNGEDRVGLYLSGGIDSSGIALWLQRENVAAECFSLDFGCDNVEREAAIAVAKHLDVPMHLVALDGADVDAIFEDLVFKLDLPFGDPVTGPQYLLGRAAHGAGLKAVFNGEGGDQLFGGWANKPMISAEVYSAMFETESREEVYLRSYHRFYGLERRLYSDAFREAVARPGARRAHPAQYLNSARATTFLNRMRLADTALKGSQNILPRAERMANAWGLDVRVPLFDRKLAELAFALPPSMKLHGAAEKYVLKLILQPHLPREIVWRRKFGMGVPITAWTLGAMRERMHDLLGPDSLARRGLFRDGLIQSLLRGELPGGETRRRRIGERLWTLAALEMWCRIFIDARGRKP